MTTTIRTFGRRERLALTAAVGAALAVSAPAVASAAPHGLNYRHVLPVRSWHPAPITWHHGGHYNNTGAPGTGTTIPPRAPWHPAPTPLPTTNHTFLQAILYFLRGFGFRF